MTATLLLLLGLTALWSSSSEHETNRDPRIHGSGHSRRHAQGRHRVLPDLNGNTSAHGGAEGAHETETIGVRRHNKSTFDDSEGPTHPPASSELGSSVGTGAVWAKLLEATEHPQCSSPPCKEGKHILEEWADLGEEMSHIEGAVVVRRPDLISPSLLAPASDLDFVKTLQSYFPIFQSSLLPRMMLEEHDGLAELLELRAFLDAVRDGNDVAGVFLYTNYAGVDEVLAQEGGWHGAIPTLMSMADVFFGHNGFIWNEKDFVVPSACHSKELGLAAASSAATGARPSHNIESFDKVVVLTQHFGDAYYHFLVENMSRLTVVLDVLLENPDIKVAVHMTRDEHTMAYMLEFLELVGIERERVLFQNQMHANLALLPSSTVCLKANEATIMVLRHALLQALYPSTEGVAPTLARPVVLLIVRRKRRGLRNSDEIRTALQQSFPSFEVVEFTGDGTIVSQLEAFATASVVVGPHGAGLSNIVVSSLHTPVLEIAPISCSTCFLHLAIKLQHIYGRHAAGTSWDKDCASWYGPDADEVVNLVRDLLEAKRQADAARAR
eukprot:g9587.t1